MNTLCVELYIGFCFVLFWFWAVKTNMKKRKNGEFVSLTFVSVKTERLVESFDSVWSVTSKHFGVRVAAVGAQEPTRGSPPVLLLFQWNTSIIVSIKIDQNDDVRVQLMTRWCHVTCSSLYESNEWTPDWSDSSHGRRQRTSRTEWISGSSCFYFSVHFAQFMFLQLHLV